MPIMTNDAIENAIFSTTLQMRKKNNGADIYSIYKQIIKTIDIDDATKEFLDNRVHTLVNDEKIINKRNRNADSCYVTTELVSTECVPLTFSYRLSLKFGACYIPVGSGEFRVNNATLCLHTLFRIFCCFSLFVFLFLMKYQISATEYQSIRNWHWL